MLRTIIIYKHKNIYRFNRFITKFDKNKHARYHWNKLKHANFGALFDTFDIFIIELADFNICVEVQGWLTVYYIQPTVVDIRKRYSP